MVTLLTSNQILYVEKRDASLQTKSLSFFVHLCPPPGGFLVLDFNVGSEESSTDDDGGFAIDAGIDMRKLLSSSSQTGGSGPNLSRQLMTHLRLLQADLQHLKVESNTIQPIIVWIFVFLKT